MSDRVEVPDIGAVSICVPRPSMLLLGPGEEHLKKAERHRTAARKQVGRGKWVQPGHELRFTNEELVFDFFEHAMAGVVLVHAALDNLLNELLPEDFTFKTDKGEVWDREHIEKSVGLELRLSRIAAAATDRPNIRDAAPELFMDAIGLKALRDDLGHAKRDRSYGRSGVTRTIFDDLFAADFGRLAQIPMAVGDHYGWG